MCEQTEVNYRDGEVVWVKLGPLWWPGRVKDVDELPEEILTSLKKKPIAAVKFFQEDTFEYVRNLNQICRYNCRQKKEFIKKGLDMYRAKKREGSKVMDKFPQDVVTAEEITKGDPNILGHSEFAPEERPDYRNIFGSDKKKEDKKGKHITSPSKDRQYRSHTSANGRHSSQILPLVQPRQIASPNFVNKVKADSEHEIRIRQQPASTPTREPSGTPSPQYKCHLCDFTSSRLNVIVLHNKFHSADTANNGQSTPSRTVSAVKGRGIRSAGSTEVKVSASRSRGRGTPSAAADRVRNRSKTAPSTVFDTPEVGNVLKEKSIPRKRLLEDEKVRSKEEESPKSSLVIPKTPEKGKVEKVRASVFGKRKGTKSSERAAKKKKSDEEIREKLLADWTDEDEEQEEKEIERIKQELSRKESLSSLPPSAASEEDNTFSTKSGTSEENRKPKDSSCFDFDETDDANLGSELEERAKKFVENRKIPRIIDDKGDSFLRRRKIEEPKPMTAEVEAFSESVKLADKNSDQKNNADSVTNTDFTVTNADIEDTEEAFKNILEETAVPKLPEIPKVIALATERETLIANDDESNSAEKCITSEKVISNEMVETKEQEVTSVISMMDEEETNIASTVPSHLDHCKVKEVNTESPLGLREAQSEENRSELPIVSNDSSDSQEISDGTVSSTANLALEEISTEDNFFTASNNEGIEQKVEKAETLRLDEDKNNTTDQSSNDVKKEVKYIGETNKFVNTTAVQMEYATVPVSTNSTENAEVNKPISAEISIKVKSTNETEETSHQDEYNNENNEINLESRGETGESMEHIKEDDVKKEDKAIQESLEAEKSEKESLAAAMKNTEIVEKHVNSEPSELQTENLPASVEKNEAVVVKEEEKKELKAEESQPEIKADVESGKKEEDKEGKDEVGLMNQKQSSSQMSLEDDELELDINSMPVVMTDAIITEDPSENKDSNITLPVILQSTQSSHPVVIKDSNTVVTPLSTVLCGTVAATSTDVTSSVETTHIASSSTNIIETQPSSIQPVKFHTVASPSTTTHSKVKTSSGTTLISQKGGKLVVIQAPGQRSRYTVGKTAQQKVAVKSNAQQQIIHQAVGTGKVVILTKPQGGGQQKILTSSLGQQHQRILTTGSKLQTQLPQRIVASTGAILTPVNPRSVVAKGGKLTPVSQQQIKALQGGKSLGTKFTMQSTQAKVILPSMQNATVTQSSPVRVIGTLKPQSNTILIQTTQGATMSSAKTVSTAAPVQAKISPTQSLQRPKLLTTAGVQRISLPVSGVKTLTQAQPKVVGLRPNVAPRMVVQKVQSPGSVGVLSNISQVRKVSGVFPRAATVQKISQSKTQAPSVQKIQQSVHKVIPLPQLGKKTLLQKISDIQPQVSKASEILVSAAAGNFQANSEASLTLSQPSMQVVQSSITVASAVQSQPSGIIITSTSQSNIITNSTLPVVTTTTAATASVLTPEQIAHVVAATPSEQVSDGSAPTYVLVTIDDSGALQPYDNSSLLAYDGSSQNEATPRTLYIDPSSIGNSGDLENIILTIDNSTAASSTVLNLGQSSTVPVNPVTSIALENQNSSVFNIISSSQPAGTASTLSSGGPNQDILAEALANTQVFQPDSSIQDSLTVVNSTPSAVMTSRILEPSSTLHQTTMLLPSLSPVLPPPNPAGVLETSLTLNQPIMTPLEVPSAVTTLQAPPPVPTSLELPLTITQPALSIPSQAFSTLTVPASTPLACISEAETSASTVSTMPVNINVTETISVLPSACNPSMPLLSEETETQNEIDPNKGTATSTANFNTATDTSCSPQHQITVSYEDPLERELDSTLEKANDTETLVQKEVSQEESSFQECDKNVSAVEANLISTDTKKLISDVIDDCQAHDSSDKMLSSTEELSTRSNNNQISETIIPANSNEALLPEQNSVECEDINKETNNSLTVDRPEEKFSDHYSNTSEQETETSVLPVSVPSFDISKNTSSHLEDTEKQASSVPEAVSNTESEIALQSPSYSHEGHPLVDESCKPSDVNNPTILSEALESKLGSEQNPHEDNNVGSTSPSETPIEHEHNSPSYEHGHILASAAPSSTAGSEKQSSVPHSMPLLIDEGEGEFASNSMEEEKMHVQKIEGLKRSSPYYNDDVSNSSSDMDPEQKRVRLESERSKDISSDDDLPSAMPLKLLKKKQFVKDDIVWLQSNKSYWPALVTNVCRKSSKVYIKTVNSPRKQKSFAVSIKRLLDFDDDKRNSELLKLGKAKYPELEKAYQRVTRFHCRKMSGENLSASRFLTYDSDDMFYGMLEDAGPAIRHNGIKEDQTEQANAQAQPDICKEFLKMEEGETVLTEEERNTRNEKAWRLLEVIKTKQCWKYLRSIYKGKEHSMRHEMFMTQERQKREYLKSIAGMSVFHDYNATKQLTSVLDGYYKQLKKDVYCKDYMYYVMLPEALIFAIQKVDNVNKEAALKTYNETSGEF